MYGQREARFLMSFFDAMERERNEIEREIYYNMDDVRVRRVNGATAEEAALYSKQIAGSCCGAFDTEIRSPNGVMYRVGFSFGH